MWSTQTICLFYLGDLLELGLGIGAVLILVGVILLSELKVLLLDLRVAGSWAGTAAAYREGIR